MTQLELIKLVKRFGDVTAVKAISLTVKPGSLVALLGPSGCGKTTTLRMIAGLEQPSEGDILFNGKSVLGIAPEKREIGMVFQRYVLFPHMSVEKNVSFGLRMKGVAKAEIDKRVKEVMKIVQLEGFEKRFPSQLSGGQQQRVAIARTVVTNPQLLLMDEPLSNLDAKLREEMRAFITDLQKRLNITTVFVTHDQIEAIELADNIGVIFDGELVQFGTPEEIFNRPANTRVADFMGATNIIIGTLNNKNLLETEAGSLSLSQSALQANGTTVTATIRPEHIDLSKDSAEKNAFSATITEAIYYGGIVSYRVQSGGLKLNIKDRSTRRFDVGEEVSVHLGEDHIWIFPS